MSDVTRRGALAGAAAVGVGAGGKAAQAGHVDMSVADARAATVAGQMVMLDIRTPGEWAESGVPDVAETLDMQAPDFLQRIAELKQENPERMIGLICATGRRSDYVAQYLHQAGLGGVVNVVGGVHGRANGWLAQGLPMKRAK